LRENEHEVRGLFFNPNIQPYREWINRRDAVGQLSKARAFPIIYLDEYPLEEFFRRVAFREGHRCRICYQWRLERTAKIAKRGNYDAFTTTLLFSKHQQHDLISQIGEEEARGRGLKFLYEDFRRGWRDGTESSMALGLYRQTYCGCVFSERDRFEPNKKAPGE
jgi:predicted adenine nucleotide alpha hydrolase (AANH) superfamily ATPase